MYTTRQSQRMSRPQPVDELLGQSTSVPDLWLQNEPWSPDGQAVSAQTLDGVAQQLSPSTPVQEASHRWIWRLKPDTAHHSDRGVIGLARRIYLRARIGVLVLGRGPLADGIVIELQSRASSYRFIGWLEREGVPVADSVSAGKPSSVGGKSNSRLGESLAMAVAPTVAQETSVIEAPVIASGAMDVCDPDTNLLSIAEREGAGCIVVAMPAGKDLPLDQLLACRLNGIEVYDGTSFYEKAGRKIALAALEPDYLIFNGGFRWPSRLAKRTLDVVLSTVGLVLALPFFALLPLIIKATSSGPVFYRQVRAGLNGRRFTILKFRSMCEEAEYPGLPVWAQEEDPRITRIGRFMRKYRLDELPQMINVLLGDMSFVGPRPERPEFVALLAKEIPFYALRLSVKPGITGWAQVMFRYGATVEDAAEKLQYDLYYIKHMSIALDSLISLKTIRTVLFQSGAR
jgi:exopolysaccharide biosynthesis polyprenyl glycosylphosphotransferase